MPENSKIRVLIVEDDSLVAEMIKGVLEETGYNVIGKARDGKNAISMARELKPDVILLDIQLPVMDGLKAAGEISKIQPTPIVVLTAYDSSDLVEEAASMGVGAFLVKPPNARELERAITVARARFADLMEMRRLNEKLRTQMIEIEKSETLYRTIIETTEDGFFMADRQGRCLEANEAFTDMLGYSREELLTMYIHDIEAKENVQETASHIEKVILDGRDRFETRHRRKDGTVIDVEISVNYLNGEQKFIVFSRDISERKRAEEALKESESVLNEVKEIAGIGSFVWNLQDDSLQYSRNMLALAGMRGEIHSGKMGDCVSKLVHPDDLGFVREEIRKMIRLRRTWSLEFRIIRPDGKERIWLSRSRLVMNEEGIPVRCIGMLQDITKQRDSEQKSNLLASLLATSAACIILHDLEGNIIYMNPSACKMHGYTPEEVEHFNLRQLDDPDTAQKMPERISDIRENGFSSFEVWHLKKDGTKFPLQVNAKPVQWNGKDAILTVALDITDRKLAEESLQQMSERLILAAKAGGVGIWDLDLVNNKLIWDEQMFHLYGIDPDKFEGTYENWKKGVHPDEVESTEKEYLMALSGEKEYNSEFRVVRPDGSTRHIRALGIVQRDELGQPLRMIGTNWDITENKRSEETLRLIAETSASSEEDFFKFLVRQLAVSQEIKTAFIAIPDDHEPDVFHTIAVWSDGGYATNFSYSLEGIPCQKVNDQGQCFYSSDVQDLFPHDHLLKEMNAESYWGTPLRDNNGRRIGLMALVDDRPMEEKSQTFSLLNSFATRAAAEIQRRQIEEELKRREYTLSKIFDILPIGLWFADSGGKLVSGNPAGVRIWGAQPHVGIEEYGVFKARRLPSGEEIAPEDWALAHTIREKATVENELLEIDAFDGKKRTILNYTAPILDDQETLIGAIVVNNDITELKETEKALHSSERLFKTLFEQASVGVAQVSPDGFFMKVNERFSEITGYSAKDLLTMNFRNITHPEDVKLDEKYILQILAGTIDSFETEKRYIHKKGHDIWITLYSRVVRDENNSVIYVIAVITDITRQKMAEKELRESQERLSLALEVSSTGFWDYYLDTGKTYMSSEIYAMTGYESTEIIQNINTFLDLTHPDDRKTISEIINNSIDSLEPFHIDFRVRHRSGEWMWLSAKGMPADIDENGRPHRLIGTQVNITPRVRAEEALLYAKACADESNRIKSEFLKNVTHELRTPLTAVIGFSDLLLCEDSGKLEGVQREHIGYINQSGQNLLEVVNRMLSFSNTDYCNLNSFEYEDVDVGQMVRDTIDILLTTALKKNIKLLKHVDPALKNVVADREKLKEILYNLVENAIKFTESSGSVNIEVKAVKGSRDAVLFSVKDTGIGIAKEKLDTIFEPFIQIDGSISRKYGGTGLGLALVKKLVEMHNGNIRVESEPGKGSNFIFEIPITPEQ